MYLNHYNLKTKPFEITANPKFLWFGETHKEAYAVLRYGVLQNKGLLLLTGEVGVGKTTLITALVEDLSDDIIHTTISDPGVSQMDFYRYLAYGFWLSPSFETKAEFVRLFGAFLYDCHDRGQKVLLIIDEAQRMEPRLLEDVRLLSNIEKKGNKLINVFFVGQTEFLDTLEGPKARALRQRITLSYSIDSLNLNATYRYIAARLKKAGAETNCFTQSAIEEIHTYSGGSPRMINVLCDMAMVVGYSKGVTRLEKQIVREGARKIPGITIPFKKRGKDIGKEIQVAPLGMTVRPVDQEIKEASLTKRRSGYYFLLVCLVLTLLFFVGMTWLTWSGKGEFPAHFSIDKTQVVAFDSPAEDPTALLMYPVTLFFADESGVMDPRSVPLVKAVASSLAEDADSLVLIRGFARGMADEAVNVKTSLSKAVFVKQRLIAAGISGKRIRIFGLGAAKEGTPATGVEGTESLMFVEIDVVK
jgi:general secretion pathway protein A